MSGRQDYRAFGTVCRTSPRFIQGPQPMSKVNPNNPKQPPPTTAQKHTQACREVFLHWTRLMLFIWTMMPVAAELSNDLVFGSEVGTTTIN